MCSNNLGADLKEKEKAALRYYTHSIKRPQQDTFSSQDFSSWKESRTKLRTLCRWDDTLFINDAADEQISICCWALKTWLCISIYNSNCSKNILIGSKEHILGCTIEMQINIQCIPYQWITFNPANAVNVDLADYECKAPKKLPQPSQKLYSYRIS